jgi:multiple sugar transport system ATP-binding protein
MVRDSIGPECTGELRGEKTTSGKLATLTAQRRKGAFPLAEVTFDRVSKVYPDGTRAVSELDIEIDDGEFMVLVGPSGCGKTTALRMLAGLEDITEGVVRIGDRVVNNLAPKDRDIAMVFQSYALYPHLSVYDNIAFSLRLKREKKDEIDRRVHEAAHVLGLETLLKRKPRALSGGQRQRVAMGRAIVRKPQAFLMDEPLSNLDAKLRVQMRAEISRLQSNLGTTTIYVTHDQIEAMTMGDRIAVMRKGELQQVGKPQELYDRPVNLFVGGFIGSPAMNMFEATLARTNGGLAVEIGDQRLALGEEALSVHPGLKEFEGRTIVLGIRPEDVEDAALVSDMPADRRLRGTIELTEALGSEIVAHISIDAKPALTEDVRELAQDIGEDLQDPAEAEAMTTLVGRLNARSGLRQGDTAELAVDTRALHFFDLETGAGIYDDGTKGASR